MTSRIESIEKVSVGEVDQMSRLARKSRLPLCGERGPGVRCTRAAGHDEALPNHPGTRHAAVDGNYITLAVWL